MSIARPEVRPADVAEAAFRREHTAYAGTTRLDELGARGGGGGDRVRVAELPGPEQSHVLAQLRPCVKPAAGVVQVHVAAVVEPRVVGAAQLVE